MLSGLLLWFTAFGHADSKLRKPSAAEQKVLAHYTDIIHSILDQLESDDWDTKTDWDIDEKVLVSEDPDVPLDVDELIQRSYTVKGGSPLYQREIAPFLEKMKHMTPTEMALAAQKLKRLQLEVEVHFNRAGVDADAKTSPQLQVPGAALSYQSDLSADKRSQTVIVIFGDWKSAQQHDDILRYHFKHAVHSPAIENIEIKMEGSPDRIQELLHSVDWKRVNQALTPAGS
jgi:hypothetical protein